MNINAAITWIFANHKVVLYGVGAVAIVLIAFSIWGILRSVMRGVAGRSRRRRVEGRYDELTEAVAIEPVDLSHEVGAETDDFINDPAFDEPQLDDLGSAPAEEAELGAGFDGGVDDLGDLDDLGDDLGAELEEQLAAEPDAYDVGSEPAIAAEDHPERGFEAGEAAVETLEFEESRVAPAAEPAPGMAGGGAYNPCTAAPVDAPMGMAPPSGAPGAMARPTVPATENIRELAEAMFEANCPRLHPAAFEEARGNVRAFAGMLAEAAETRLTDAERARIAAADVQLQLHGVLQAVAKRRDEEKYAILVTLLIGRIKHDDKPDIVDLLDQSIGVVSQINNIAHLRIVIMCLYLRSINLRSNQIGELENIVKYATTFGTGSNFSNLRTGSLFSQGLLMYNAGLDRIEGQLLRSYSALMGVDPNALDAYPGENADARQIVYERLNLSEDQAAVLDSLGQSQCGRATATGIGWAAAAAYIEAHTGQPADWERMIR